MSKALEEWWDVTYVAMNEMPSEEQSTTLADSLRQIIESPDASVG